MRAELYSSTPSIGHRKAIVPGYRADSAALKLVAETGIRTRVQKAGREWNPVFAADRKGNPEGKTRRHG